MVVQLYIGKTYRATEKLKLFAKLCKKSLNTKAVQEPTKQDLHRMLHKAKIILMFSVT